MKAIKFMILDAVPHDTDSVNITLLLPRVGYVIVEILRKDSEKSTLVRDCRFTPTYLNRFNIMSKVCDIDMYSKALMIEVLASFENTTASFLSCRGLSWDRIGETPKVILEDNLLQISFKKVYFQNLLMQISLDGNLWDFSVLNNSNLVAHLDVEGFRLSTFFWYYLEVKFGCTGSTRQQYIANIDNARLLYNPFQVVDKITITEIHNNSICMNLIGFGHFKHTSGLEILCYENEKVLAIHTDVAFSIIKEINEIFTFQSNPTCTDLQILNSILLFCIQSNIIQYTVFERLTGLLLGNVTYAARIAFWEPILLITDQFIESSVTLVVYGLNRHNQSCLAVTQSNDVLCTSSSEGNLTSILAVIILNELLQISMRMLWMIC